MKTEGLEGGEEGAPVGFGLAEGDADTKDGAFAIKADANGYEYAQSRSWPPWRTFS